MPDQPNSPVESQNIIWFPSEKKEVFREEALKLRQVFEIMAPVHFVLLLVDTFVYGFELMAILGDLVFCYACFYNYMTLKKATIGAQGGLYVLAVVVSLSHLQRILRDGSKLITIFYFLQFFVVYTLAAFFLFKRLKDHHDLQMLYREMKESRGVKG